MDWTSWSLTWSTKRTTTTSRKPLRRRRKHLRWKRMYLLLRADQRLKQNHEDVLLLAHLQDLYLSVKDLGLMLSQELVRISLTQCQIGWVLFFVMVIYLEKKMERLNSGDKKDDLRNKFEHSRHWSDEMRKSKMGGGGGNKKIFQYCTDSSGQEILDLRALQGHSGRNLIDPTLSNKVLIPDNFFKYIHHIGCAINLHSITNAGLIPGGQNLG